MPQSAGAIIVTHDRRLLLQRRDDKAGLVNGGRLGVFGGYIEDGEYAAAALCRELHEELGAIVTPKELRPVLTRAYSLPDGQPITLHHFLWLEGTPRVTGIYEGSAATFATVTEVLAQGDLVIGSTRNALLAAQALVPEGLR